MKVIKEVSLQNFKFWAGAKDHAKYLTDEQMNHIECLFEESNPNGMTETEINDFFWFYEDTIASYLGFDSFEALKRSVDLSEEEQEAWEHLEDDYFDDEYEIEEIIKTAGAELINKLYDEGFALEQFKSVRELGSYNDDNDHYERFGGDDALFGQFLLDAWKDSDSLYDFCLELPSGKVIQAI